MPEKVSIGGLQGFANGRGQRVGEARLHEHGSAPELGRPLANPRVGSPGQYHDGNIASRAIGAQRLDQVPSVACGVTEISNHRARALLTKDRLRLGFTTRHTGTKAGELEAYAVHLGGIPVGIEEQDGLESAHGYPGPTNGYQSVGLRCHFGGPTAIGEAG